MSPATLSPVSDPTQPVSGFTVVELMIVLVIVGILLGIGVPAYNTFIQNQCLSTKASSLMASLALARSEAIKRRANVVVRASDTANAGNEWGAGWTVFVDTNNNGTRDDTEETLRVVTQEGCGATAMDEISGVVSVQYRPTGVATTAVTIRVCDGRANEDIRQLSVTPTGRASVTVIQPTSAFYPAGCT